MQVKIAVRLNNLGDALSAAGDHKKEKELVERALVIDERAYGPDHVEVLGLSYRI